MQSHRPLPSTIVTGSRRPRNPCPSNGYHVLYGAGREQCTGHERI